MLLLKIKILKATENILRRIYDDVEVEYFYDENIEKQRISVN